MRYMGINEVLDYGVQNDIIRIRDKRGAHDTKSIADVLKGYSKQEALRVAPLTRKTVSNRNPSNNPCLTTHGVADSRLLSISCLEPFTTLIVILNISRVCIGVIGHDMRYFKSPK